MIIIKRVQNKIYQKSCLVLLCLLFLFLSFPVQAAESYITGTVSVTPLKLELTARKWVFLNKKFNFKAVVENVGQQPIDDIALTLQLPIGLNLIKGQLNQNINSLNPWKKEILNWQIQANQLGTYIIQLTGQGIEQGSSQLITVEDSLTIEVKKQRFYHLILQRLYSFFNSIF